MHYDSAACISTIAPSKIVSSYLSSLVFFHLADNGGRFIIFRKPACFQSIVLFSQKTTSALREYTTSIFLRKWWGIMFKCLAANTAFICINFFYLHSSFSFLISFGGGIR